MGTKMHNTCGKLLLKIMRRCAPDNATEEAVNIDEMIACHTNGFKTLWNSMKVIAKMMDVHRAPTLPVYKGRLLQHAGVWDVYRMMMHHRGMVFEAQDCNSIGFPWDITDPRFLPAATVELGMLAGLIPNDVSEQWVMPGWYAVQVMAARILENSPSMAIKEEDLGQVPARGMINTLDQRQRSKETSLDDKEHLQRWEVP
jgi:hypothetical protein